MKTSCRLKLYLSFILTFIVIASTYAQKVNKYDADSLQRVWQQYFDSIATVKRVAFLELFENIPVDTTGTINMSGLHLENLPDISRFNNIYAIDAQGNKLAKVPGKLLKIDSLKRVNLSNNELKRICFPRNTTIESLDLSKNNFRRIPRSIKRLKHLNYLTISDNQIKHIPYFLKRMQKLNSIEVNFNQIKPNKRDIKRLKNIEILVMAGNNITELPENINDLEKIKKLNFSKNKLTSLPPNFALLDSLEIIIFYQNEFDHIPLEITQIPTLKIIDFYYNHISEIPDKVGNLQNLTMIFLAYNDIEVLPDTLRSLQKLKAFYIHDNQVRYIHAWVTNFKHLEVLDISYNKLFSIPDMSKMPALYEVDMQENNIEYFPWKLIDKPNLRLLIIRGNPFLLDEDENDEIKNKIDEKRAAGVVIID